MSIGEMSNAQTTSDNGESDLPDGWAKVALAEVTQRIPNVNPNDEPNRELGYIDISSIDNTRFTVVEQKRFKGSEAPSRARRPIQPGDVLFSNVRTYLRNIALVPDDCDADLCSTGFTVIRSNGAADPKYLFFYTLTDAFVDPLTDQQTGSNYPATSDRVVFASEIPLPPLAEQRQIVAAVEALLARVVAARARLDRAPALLRRFRQAVLAHATTGHLTVDWREENGGIESVAILRERLQIQRELFYSNGRRAFDTEKVEVPDFSWTDDDLLPSTWALAKIQDMIDIQNGRSFPSKQYCDRGFRLLRPGNLHVSGGVEWTDKNSIYLQESWAERFPEFVVGPNDLLMNLTAQSLKDEFLGRVCLNGNETPALSGEWVSGEWVSGEWRVGEWGVTLR